MAGVNLPWGGFQDQSFAFQGWKYTDKRQKWKGKVQKNAQVPCCGQTKVIRCEIVLQGIQGCFLHCGALGLFWINQFWRNFMYILYSMVKKSTFLKGNFCMKVSKMFCTLAWKKNYKMLPDLKLIFCWILPCSQPILLAWTDPRSTFSVRRIAIKDWLMGFWIQRIK